MSTLQDRETTSAKAPWVFATVAVAAALALALGAGTASAEDLVAQAPAVEVTPFDRPLGDPDAPVTIIEYASFSCGHCGAFHNETWPELKERYVDTGQVFFLFRDFPLNELALAASMLTHCVPEDAYHATVTELFRSQEEWMAPGSDPIGRFLAIGVFAGAEEAALEACMADRPLAEAVAQVRIQAEADYDVSGTPTFIINGETLTGNRPIETFEEIIERLSAEEAG